MEEKTLSEKYYPKDFNQVFLPKRILDIIEKNKNRKGYRLLFYGPAGTGKCLGYGTEILMFDGTIKEVQNIKVGDVLMGWDSKPRNVISTTRGKEELIKIIPTKGKPWICNKSHILSVIETGKWKTFEELPHSSYIEDHNVMVFHNKTTRNHKKLFRVPLSFQEQEIHIDPYWLGYWLGDGISSRPSLCVGYDDVKSIEKYMWDYAQSLNLNLNFGDSRGSTEIIRFVANEKNGLNKTYNVLTENLKYYNVLNNKHIPKQYLKNSREIRLKLFAGLVDSDGGGSQKDKIYDFCLIKKELSKDLAWLCRSLGYNVNETIKIINGKEYYRTMISGDFSDLNKYILHKRKIFNNRLINKNPLVFGFKTESIGEGDYYGFEIDGDKRFMLGDFTVTHNTTTARLLNPKDKFEVLFKSGSNDFTVQTLRESIYPFIASHSHILSKQKTVIIDECERMKPAIQDAWKVPLDQAKNINFIFITNNIENVTPYIKSRFDKIEFNYKDDELQQQKINYINYIINICKTENIKYTDSGVRELFIKNFPDFRQILRVLQQFLDTSTEVNANNVKSMIESALKDIELYKIFEIMDAQKFYEKANYYKGREKETLMSLGEPFFEYLNDLGKFDKTLKCAPIVANYSNQYITTFNKFVCLFSCLTEIKNILK